MWKFRFSARQLTASLKRDALLKLSDAYTKSLANVPLERPAIPGQLVNIPVCEYVEARWIGVTRLVPQFTDGIVMNTGLPLIRRFTKTDLKVGDVLICCPMGDAVQGVEFARDKLSGAVRVFTRGVFTHAAIIGRDLQVFEAVLPCVQCSEFEKWLGSFAYVVIFRHPALSKSTEKQEATCQFLDRAINQRYNMARALGMLLVGVSPGRAEFRASIINFTVRLVECIAFRNCQVCSTFVWSALLVGGVASDNDNFGTEVTPSGFLDHVLLEPVGYATAATWFQPHRLDSLQASYQA